MPNGEATARVLYTPYGEVRWQEGTLTTDYGFTGQRKDYYTQLHQMGARWYDAQIGRWISPDTIVPDPANPQSLNRYAYVLGNPLRYIDPTGFYDEEVVDAYMEDAYGPDWEEREDAEQLRALRQCLIEADPQSDYNLILFINDSGGFGFYQVLGDRDDTVIWGLYFVPSADLQGTVNDKTDPTNARDYDLSGGSIVGLFSFEERHLKSQLVFEGTHLHTVHWTEAAFAKTVCTLPLIFLPGPTKGGLAAIYAKKALIHGAKIFGTGFVWATGFPGPDVADGNEVLTWSQGVGWSPTINKRAMLVASTGLVVHYDYGYDRQESFYP